MADYDKIEDKATKGGSNNEVLASADDFEKDLKVNASAFEVLERDFQDVINELMGEESLEKFRLEYEKLHRALKKSHDQEKRLVKKCRELNNEILSNQAKIKTALRLSQEDQKTIAHLQKEMEKTWKLVYASQEKESRAMETINALKEELVNLSTLLDKSSLAGSDQEMIVNELSLENEELQKQITEKALQLQEFERSIQHINKLNQGLQNDKVQAGETIQALNLEIENKDKEIIQITRKKEKFQKDFELAASTNEEDKKHIDKLTEDIKNVKSVNVDVNNQLKEAKNAMVKHLKEYDLIFNKAQSLQQNLELQIQAVKEKRQEVFNLENELKFANLEIGRLTADRAIWEKKYEKEHRDVSHYKEMAESSKIPLMLAKQENEALQQEIINLNRKENELKSKTELVVKEKEKQLSLTQKAENKIKENLDTIGEHTRIEKELMKEMELHRADMKELKTTIASLERDREKLTQEIAKQRSNYLSSEEEIKIRDVQIQEISLKVADGESKLRHQLSLYETIRNDRNNLAKSLNETSDELNALKRDYTIYKQQVNELKDELSLKEQQIIKEQYETSKMEKIKESLQNELQRKNQLFASDHELVSQYESQIKHLTSLIKKSDMELMEQKRAYDHLVNERDVIGIQLIRRNDEIALLVEKIRVQQSALETGEIQYNERLNDIQILKTKIRDITREHNVTKNSGIKIAELKRNILNLERDLLQERTRVTALSEELENPMNIHRWRKLEGSDPAAYELIQKVQILQKKLISKTEEVVEKALVIQDKDKLYEELQDLLKRQPGPEVGEQVVTYQRNLRAKNSQMKVMISELNMYQAQSHEYKYEMERLAREVQDLKRKYFQQKREHEQIQDVSKNIDNSNLDSELVSNSMGGGAMMSRTAPNMTAKTRIAGGGFVIKN